MQIYKQKNLAGGKFEKGNESHPGLAKKLCVIATMTKIL